MQQVEFWSLIRVLEVTGISQSEVYRLMKKDQFPKSHKYGAYSNREFWMSYEVRAWQQEQIGYHVPELHVAEAPVDLESFAVTISEFDGLL